MTSGIAIDLVRHAVMLSLLVAAPLLLTAVAVGVLVSLVQAVTQVQEQTLTFLPKLAVMALVFTLALPWLLHQLCAYAAEMFRTLPRWVAG
jgi:flagellar biosynthetic protein FliQ